MKLLTVVLTSTLAFAASGPAEAPDAKAAIRLFEGWIEGQMAYRGLPGIAVGVVYDQNLVWSRGFGVADTATREPVTPKTKFRVASHTKLFTAVAIMQLRDAGKLRLDDPVAQHLAWFRIRPAIEDDPPITIEQLLTHFSGLPREAGIDYWTTFAFPTTEDVKRLVNNQTAAFAPEVRWKYSNLAFSLAGMIVEKLSGEAYENFVKRRILEPLGMTDSSVDRPVAGLATGYGRRMPDGSRKKMDFMDTRGIGAAAGLTSTVEDMAKFISLQFRKGRAGGAQILAGTTLREMHRVRMMENNWTRGNGIGFAVSRDKDRVQVGHGGSLAGYKSHTVIRVADKVGVVVLTNGDDSQPAQIAGKLMATVGEAVAKAGAPAKEEPKWDPAWSRFAGLYRSIWGDTEVVEMNRALVMIDPVADDPADQQKLIPHGVAQFKLEAPTGGPAVGEIVRFGEEGGRVTHVVVGNVRLEKIR
jgi:CubicO group peptidase (beta-lactamase class C family)